MYFDSLQSLLDMNDHGAYVWSAYAIGFIVLTILIWQPLARHAQLKQDILRQLAEEQ